MVLFLGVLLLSLTGCGQTPYRAEMSLPVDEQLFFQGEEAFAAHRYDEALGLYEDLLSRYPKGRMAAAALLKSGMIHGLDGDHSDAEKAWDRLVRDYPMSPFATEAFLESMMLSYRTGDYTSVIQKGVNVPDTLSPADYRPRKYAIMGDAYLALGDRVDAVGAYFNACDLVSPGECVWVVKRLRGAVDSLTLAEAREMLSRTHQKEKRGYLLFRHTMALADGGQVDAALKEVNDFLALYSEHPVREDAVVFRERLSRSHFNPKVLGCLLPFTGRYGEYGRQAREGIELAFQEAISGGGMEDFQLVFRDTASSDAMARQGVRELVEAGAAAIIGPVGNAESAAAEAQLRGVPMIAMTGKDGIAASGDFIFRNFMTPRMQVRSVVSYAFEVLGVNDFAILYPDEPYGRDFMNIFWDEVNRYGGEIRGVEAYASNTVDFSKALKKLMGLWYANPTVKDSGASWGRVFAKGEKRTKPPVDFDAIFIPDGAQSLGMILPQLAFQDLGGVYALGTNLWHDAGLMKREAKYLGNSIIPDGFFARSRDPHVREFVRSFKRAFGRTPGYIEAVAFDSASISLALLYGKMPLTRSEVRDALLAVRGFHGVTGVTSFDEVGEVDKVLTLLKGERRRFVEVPR